MTASLADVADPRLVRQVFLEEFETLLDAGCTVAVICGKLAARPGTIETRLRRGGRPGLAARWERKCRAAGIDT